MNHVYVLQNCDVLLCQLYTVTLIWTPPPKQYSLGLQLYGFIKFCLKMQLYLICLKKGFYQTVLENVGMALYPYGLIQFCLKMCARLYIQPYVFIKRCLNVASSNFALKCVRCYINLFFYQILPQNVFFHKFCLKMWFYKISPENVLQGYIKSCGFYQILLE